MSSQTGITFNPRGNLIKPTVQSSLATRRALGAPWRTQRQGQIRADRTTNIVGQLQRQINQIQTPGQATSGLRPFQLYNFPKDLRVYTHDDDWRRVKVRGGFLQNNSVDYVIQGTDGNGATAGRVGAGYMDYETYLYPYTIEQTDHADSDINDFWHEVVIPDDGSVIYFWISLCFGNSQQAEIFYSAEPIDPTAYVATSLADGASVTDIWPTWPAKDPYHQLIGCAYVEVGNSSEGLSPQLVIHNSYTGDFEPTAYDCNVAQVPSLPTWECVNRYRGAYDAGIYYYVGDIITQTTPDVNGNNWLYQWCYYPDSAATTSYPIIDGPIIGIDPQSNNPDPFALLSKSPIDANYATGAFVSSDYYLKT